MINFIRPELRAQIARWREALVGVAALALGLYWIAIGLGALWLFGWVTLAIGTALIIAGAQRARFRVGVGGPGVVQVDEGQVAYYGPLDGGAMAVDDMSLLELEPDALPSPHWVLTDLSGNTIHIPTTATGADTLFDVFAALPGIKTEAMLARLNRAPDQRVTIWRRGGPQP